MADLSEGLSRADLSKAAAAAASAKPNEALAAEMPFSGSELVLGVLAAHRPSGRRAVPGLSEPAIARLAVRKADLPQFAVDRVAEWLPLVLQKLQERGLVENLNRALHNVKPAYALSAAGRQRAEAGSLPAGASEVAAAPVRGDLRGAGRRRLKRKVARPVRVAAGTLQAARKLAQSQGAPRAEPKALSTAATATTGTDRRRAAAQELLARKRAELVRQRRGLTPAAAPAAAQPAGGGTVLSPQKRQPAAHPAAARPPAPAAGQGKEIAKKRIKRKLRSAKEPAAGAAAVRPPGGRPQRAAAGKRTGKVAALLRGGLRGGGKLQKQKRGAKRAIGRYPLQEQHPGR